MERLAVVFRRHVNRQKWNAVVAALVLLIYRLWVSWRSKPRNVFIPLAHHWLFGALDLVRAQSRKQLLEFLRGLHGQFGPTFACKPPLQPWMVITSCPKNVEYILSTNYQNFGKGSWFSGKCLDLLGRGIFNADGEDWYYHRKAVHDVFEAKLFKEHIWTVVRQNARNLREILLSAEAQQSVDVLNLMNRFALDTIAAIGFGKCIGSLEDPSSPLLRSFDRAQGIALERIFKPHWRLLKLLRLGSESETHEHIGRLDEYIRSVVRDLRWSTTARVDEAGKSGGILWADVEARKSLLGLFLADAKDRGEDFSEDYLRDFIISFLIAGRDTTAQTLSWTIYCLSQNLEVAEKARREIQLICGVKGPAYDDLDNLKYLEAVLNEVLRLYPPIPFDGKAAVIDNSLPDGTFLPGGTMVYCNAFAMGRDPSSWGEDSACFRPERWLEMEAPPSYFSHTVFHAGPREYLGKRLAQVEMKTCLAILLPQFSFELAAPANAITYDGTLAGGLGLGLPCFVKQIGEKTNCEMSSTALTQSDSESFCSDYSSGQSECSDTTSDIDPSAKRERRRHSGRARQRERRRRRVHTPSPDRFVYGP